MTHVIQYKGYSSNRRLSPQIWGDCPILEIQKGVVDGLMHDDDFKCAYDFATNTAVANTGQYEIFTGNGPSLAGSVARTGTTLATAEGGVQNFVSGTSADVLAVMTLGGGAPFVVSDTAGADKKLWFECRFKISSVTDADQVQWFCGLTEEDRSAAAGIFAAGGGDLGFTTTIDLMGFARFDNDGDSISFVYQKASQTCQDVAQFAIAADTYYKFGFVYDPLADASERIKIYQDGVLSATKVTATNIAAATFPDGEEMTMTMGVQNDDTTSNTVSVDWWACAQLG